MSLRWARLRVRPAPTGAGAVDGLINTTPPLATPVTMGAVANGTRTWHRLQRDEWGVHFNVSADGKLFSSDGGDSKMVAHADNGKWMWLFRPDFIEDRSAGNVDTKNLIQTGVFRAERLVNMAKHDYALEPNGMFSPDQKWLIFRSNMSGANQCYAVELAPAKPR